MKRLIRPIILVDTRVKVLHNKQWNWGKVVSVSPGILGHVYGIVFETEEQRVYLVKREMIRTEEELWAVDSKNNNRRSWRNAWTVNGNEEISDSDNTQEDYWDSWSSSEDDLDLVGKKDFFLTEKKSFFQSLSQISPSKSNSVPLEMPTNFPKLKTNPAVSKKNPLHKVPSIQNRQLKIQLQRAAIDSDDLLYDPKKPSKKNILK
eukprot:TRINITY_DN160_c0_g1_i2.p2 TRINITY_DN160_c0_g1~~TRINITY_DN160_c0_g1_i2.p2  ORF type:complete len:205 (-),score=63.81 TRINITY_DN160_c0_g1_i2:24-638(-)